MKITHQQTDDVLNTIWSIGLIVLAGMIATIGVWVVKFVLHE